MTCQLLQTSLEHHQLEIGSFTPFLQLLFDDYIMLISPTWMTVLWEFVSDHNIDLSHHSSPRIGPLRINDKALMDIFSQEHDIPTQVKISINNACMYYRLPKSWTILTPVNFVVFYNKQFIISILF